MLKYQTFKRLNTQKRIEINNTTIIKAGLTNKLFQLGVSFLVKKKNDNPTRTLVIREVIAAPFISNLGISK